MTTPSPTPSRFFTYDEKVGEPCEGTESIADKEGHVATVETPELAALIVAAVNEREELVAENERLKDELKIRAKQIGVACLKHDLTHSLKCGRCYSDMVNEREADKALIGELVEALRELRDWWEKDGGILEASLAKAKAAIAKAGAA